MQKTLNPFPRPFRSFRFGFPCVPRFASVLFYAPLYADSLGLMLSDRRRSCGRCGGRRGEGEGEGGGEAAPCCRPLGAVLGRGFWRTANSCSWPWRGCFSGWFDSTVSPSSISTPSEDSTNQSHFYVKLISFSVWTDLFFLNIIRFACSSYHYINDTWF